MEGAVLSETLGNCYVCLDSGAPLSPCVCKGMYLHRKCQIQLIRKQHKDTCTICLQKFDNVEVTFVKSFRCSLEGKLFCTLVGTGVFCHGLCVASARILRYFILEFHVLGLSLDVTFWILALAFARCTRCRLGYHSITSARVRIL